jgi:EmrB/QacA subfamily drug resistance transporter
MGAGGAMIMPSTLSILTNVFRDPKERGRAIAIWAGVSGLGVALGPVIGGVLLRHFSWSSVFWVNLPIGATALVAGHFFVPESKDPAAPRLDLVGAVLSMVTLGSLLFGVIEGPTKGWSSGVVLGAFAIGVVALVTFISWELRSEHPMLDMSFFKSRRFTAANAAVTLVFFALMGSLFLLTQYWQFVHGYTPLQAGVRLLPYAATMMIVAPSSARLVERVGTKAVVTFGLSVIAVALVGLSQIHAESSYLRVIVNMCVMALGMGLVMAPATESVMGSLPPAKAGVGSAVNDTTRQMGGAVGIAAIGSIVASVYASKVSGIAQRFGVTGRSAQQAKASLGGALEAAPAAGAQAPQFVRAVREAFVSAFAHGVVLSAVVIAATAVVTWLFLPARADDHVTADDMLQAVIAGEELAPVVGS